MKKMNKKGFTLAELLIVIAIIAILIAIAIPIFAAQLENARVQTDHANIRSAYAIVQTANIMGEIEVGSAGSSKLITTKPVAAGGETANGKTYYFQKDGSVVEASTNAYVLLGKGNDSCASSAGCQISTNKHEAGNNIKIVVATDGSVSLVIG